MVQLHRSSVGLLLSIVVLGGINPNIENATAETVPKTNVMVTSSSVLSLLEQGKQQYRKAELRSAITIYQQAIELAKQQNLPLLRAKAMAELATIYSEIEKKQEAETILLEALQAVRKSEEQQAEKAVMETDILVILADFYVGKSDLKKSRELYGQAQVVAKSIGYAKGLLSIKIGIESVRWLEALQKKQFKQALEQSQVIFKLAQELDEQETIANGYGVQWLSYIALQDIVQSERLFQEYQTFSKSTGYRFGELRGFLWGASRIDINKEPEKRLSYYQQAEAIAKSVDNPWFQLAVAKEIAWIHMNQKQTQKAIKVYEEALVVARTLDEEAVGDIENRIGVAYYRAGEYQKAIEYYQKSLSLYQKSSNKSMLAQVLFNLGEAHRELKQYSNSIDFLKQALPIYAELQDRVSVGLVHYWIGKAHDSSKSYEKALESYRQALIIYEGLNNQGGVAEVLQEIASVKKQLGQYDEAILNYQKAISLFSELKWHGKEAQALNGLAYTYLFRNTNFVESQKFLEAEQDADLAMSTFQQSKNKAQQASERFFEAAAVSGIASSYARKASIYESSGNNQRSLQLNLEAIKYQENALSLFAQIDNLQAIDNTIIDLALSHSSLARIYNSLAQYQKSLAAIQETRLLYQKIKDRNRLDEIENQLKTIEILVYFKLINLDDIDERNYLEKIKSYRRVIDLARQTNSYGMELNAMKNIAGIYLKIRQRDEAILWHQKVIDRAMEIDRSQYANYLGFGWRAIGSIYENQGQYDKALEYYSKALELSRTRSDKSEEAQSLGGIASIYKIRGEFQRSIDHYQESLEIFRERFGFYKQGVNRDTIKAICLEEGYFDRLEKDRPGFQAYQCQNLDRSPLGIVLKSFQKSIRNQEILAHQSMAVYLNNLANVYSAQGNYGKSLELYQQSNAMERALRPHGSEVVSLGNLAQAYMNLGDLDKALSFTQQALKLAEFQKTTSRIMEAKNNLGKVYEQMGKTVEALALYQESLRFAEELDRPSDKASILQNMGGLYFTKGNYAKALEVSQRAYQIAENIGKPLGTATSLGSLGSLHQSFGQYDQALKFQYKALEIVNKIGAKPDISANLLRIASSYRDKGDFKQAADYYQQALTVAQGIDDVYWLSRIRASMAGLYSRQQQPDKALNLLQQALATQQKMGVKREVATTLSLIGKAQAEINQLTEAQDSLQQSIALSQEVGDRPTEAEALGNLGELLAKQNQPESAIAFYKKSVNIYEEIRNNLRSLSRETQENYTSSIAKTYRNLADLLLSQGRTREAQEILELLKVQENRGYDRASQSQKPTLKIILHPLEQEALTAFETAIAQKHPLTLQDYQKFNQTLQQNRDRLIQDGNTRESTIGNPQNLITNPNTILIQNLVVNDKIWVLWTSQSGGTQAIATPVSQTDLDQTVTQFREQISSPTSSLTSLQTTSQKLHNWLIPPALQAELAQQPKQHLIFSLDHLTRYIPIATLYNGQQYLTQRYQLSNIISTDTDTRDRLPTAQNTPVLALGTSQPFPGFSGLKFVPIELGSISQDGNSQGLYPGKKQMDNAFTRDALKSLDRYRVLHIATHGQFNPTNILNSFLLLGNGDRLPISEIDQLTNLGNTHLVVLSACETGLSDVRSDGTEISGISGYFLYRGAKSVMASLWKVSDPSTALFMQQFYRHLADGKTKAEGIQQVQQDFIAGKQTIVQASNLPRSGVGTFPSLYDVKALDYSHPFYWAPFILVGNSL